jgi:hypothetical protein
MHASSTPNLVPHIPARISSGAQGKIKPGRIAIDTKSQNPLESKKLRKCCQYSINVFSNLSPPNMITLPYKIPIIEKSITTKLKTKKNLFLKSFKYL